MIAVYLGLRPPTADYDLGYLTAAMQAARIAADQQKVQRAAL